MAQHWKIGIVGGTGYIGAELLRLLLGHPFAILHTITSRNEVGIAVADYFHSLRGCTDLKFSDPAEGSLQECDVVFFATPHGVAMKQAADLLQHGVRIIDLSADFRLQDPQQWARWYGMEHTALQLLPQAIYGLPELHRSAIRTARLVANPGCYPTAVLLGFLPLLKTKKVAMDGLIADAKSGISGAGRKVELPLMFAEAADSISAYGVPGHRHLPEIVQQMSQMVGREVGLTFVPHLMPMIRGMQATLYGTLLTSEMDTDLQALYEKFYEGEPFVDVLPAGSHPTTRSVRAANMCRLAVHRPGRGDKVVVLSVIDNLVKGAAGQAIQNMNLMMGAPEAAGLKSAAVLP